MVVVNVISVSGEYRPSRFLIDNDIQAHFIARKFCKHNIKITFLFKNITTFFIESVLLKQF